jgi:hypothetical protein
MFPDIFAAIRSVIGAFQTLGIPYHIGGSVASSALGVARTTVDVDLVAEIRSDHIKAFVEALQHEYYIDGDAIADAVAHRSSFNLVHLETMIKVDVFIPKADTYAQEAFSRRSLDRLAEDDEGEVYIESAEDVILHKLDWYRMGGEVSERQWNDLTGVLKVQREDLNKDYLRRWASELGLTNLLDRAMREAGLI